MNVKLSMKLFIPLKKNAEGTSEKKYGGCIDPNIIIGYWNYFNCSDSCIPTIFSSLFDMSTFKECANYDSHFCALDRFFGHLEGLECKRTGEEKSFDGIVEVGYEISYSNFLGYILSNIIENKEDDDLRKRTLLTLRWGFLSRYGTVYEEELLYDEKDLFAWAGGAIGLFVGYSIFDLISQIIDGLFYFISRSINTEI